MPFRGRMPRRRASSKSFKNLRASSISRLAVSWPPISSKLNSTPAGVATPVEKEAARPFCWAFKYKAKPTAPATKIMGKASLTPLEMSIKAKKPRPTPAKISINHLRFSAATPRCSGLGPVAGNDFVQVIIAPVELEVNPIRIHIKAYMIQAPLAPRVQQALGRLGEGAPGHGFGHVAMESIVVGQQLGASPVGHPEGDGAPARAAGLSPDAPAAGGARDAG